MKLLEIKNGNLNYFGNDLKELAIKYGTPLKITFLDVIKERVVTLKNAFDKAIKEENYNGKFIYLNANKANYSALEIRESYKWADGLETSSFYDAIYSHKIFELESAPKDRYFVSNGYKLKDYIDEIVKVSNEGYHVIDVIDSLSEYEMLKEMKVKLEVGLRIHLSAQYNEEGDIVENDRFGLTKEDFNYIIDDIKNTSLVLSTIHFHQRGFDYEEEKFDINFNKAFKDYYVYAAKKYDTVSNFDIGGGTPLPMEGSFDYDAWAKRVIKNLKAFSKANDVKEPNLISENGKYSQKDSIVNIYKVIGKKNTDSIPWYIVDGSPLIAMPEMYALGEPIKVMPINGLDKDNVKCRLAGVTCDCDDVYYLKDKGYFEVPNVDELFIGLIGTGSYQNSMNGKGGVHHCLLPEEKDLVIYTENGVKKEFLRHDLQSIEKIFELTGLK